MATKEDFIPFKPQHTAVRNLMLLMAYVFVFSWIIDRILPEFTSRFLALHSNPRDVLFTPWTLLTGFLGSNGIFDLIGHCVWLFFFGRISEDLLGKKKMYNFFFVAGAIASISYILIVGVAFGKSHAMFTAAPAVAAIVYGTAVFRPFYEVYLFGTFKVQLRWIAVFKLFFDVVIVFNPVTFGSGSVTLIGGLVGVIGMMHSMGSIKIPLLDILSGIQLKKKERVPKRTASVKINLKKSKAKQTKKGDAQAEIDAILDKINKAGYSSLTEKEKQTLFNNSKEI
jgi:membrane associated rhomboid family serine protease